MENRGTYAGIRYDQQSIDIIVDWCKQNNVPNARTAIDRVHTTIIYSKKYIPELKPIEKLDPPLSARADGLEIWEIGNNTGMKSRALILMLFSPTIYMLHEQLMEEHKATFDYKIYHPHITLSYNVYDRQFESFFKFPNVNLYATSLYVEDLNIASEKFEQEIMLK